MKTKFGHTVTIGRTAILTKNHNGRAACHYCGPCERGCANLFLLQQSFHDRQRRAQDQDDCTLVHKRDRAHVNLEKGENRASGVTLCRSVSTNRTKEVKA